MRTELVLVLAVCNLASPRLPFPPLRSSIRSLLGELSSLQCSPRFGSCTSRRRARPWGGLPRGRGLPPIPGPLKGPKGLKTSRALRRHTLLPPWPVAPPRMPTTAPPVEGREVPKRLYWRGVTQDHFRNLSPNAKNHRFGRDLQKTQPSQLRESPRTGSDPDTLVNNQLPELTYHAEHDRAKTVQTINLVTNSVDTTFIKPTKKVEHGQKSIDTTVTPVKVYYDTLFINPMDIKRPEVSNHDDLKSLSRARSTTSKPNTKSSTFYPTPKPLKISTESPFFTPTKRTGKKKGRRGKVKKFIRHSLPSASSEEKNETKTFSSTSSSTSLSSSYSSNEKSTPKRPSEIASDIIALFKEK